MSNIKKNFPIFQTHPDLVYLDSTATSQKPSYVIDGVAEYLSSSYANIHRGSYEISEISEKLYQDSKKIVAQHIGATSWREIVYTANSTYALNLLAQSIWRTGILKKGDTVLVSITEHHANIVPWLILKQDHGIEVDYVGVREDYSLDFDDLEKKLDDTVKIVSLTHVSNTTGQIFELERVDEMLDEVYGPHPTSPYQGEEQTVASSLLTKEGIEEGHRPLFIVDASQSVPHFQVDVEQIGCDAMFFTGHKVFADSGVGILWARQELLTQLQPAFSGGGAIAEVTRESFIPTNVLPDKFEPGTPNLSGAVSLLKAFEYIEQIGGYEELERIEHELVEYTLEKFTQGDTSPNPSLVRRGETVIIPPLNKGRLGGVYLVGGTDAATRVGVFTFYVPGIHSHDIAEYLAENNICIRAGQHCAEPFMKLQGQNNTCRMSLYIYNTKEDIDRFFEVLEQAILELR